MYLFNERKLLTYPKVEGIVFGNWGEASQATHQLVEELASSRARSADPQTKGRRGQLQSEEGKKAWQLAILGESLVLRLSRPSATHC